MPLFAREDVPRSIDQGYRLQCPVCALLPFLERERVPSMSEIRESAKGGCPDCQVIVEGIDASGYIQVVAEEIYRTGYIPIIAKDDERARYVPGTPVETVIKISLLAGEDGGPLLVAFGEHWGIDLLAPTLSYFVTPESSIKNPDARIGNHISATAGSPSCFAIANMWLDVCRTQHRCHRPDPRKVPRRLLDVSSSSQTVRIVDTHETEFDRSCQYVCLSYCWGTGPKQLLSKSNLASMLQHGVRMETQILCDAATATRNLHIKYLWVDALCIVQDDRRDWEVESSRMGDIYSNAAVTVVAASAQESRSSFLSATEQRRRSQVLHVCKSPDPRIRPDVFVRWFTPGGLEDESQDAFEDEPKPLGISNSYARGFSFGDHCEIDKRGWTLQEELLSSRVLRFDPTGLVFRCSEKVWTEDGRAQKPYPGSIEVAGTAAPESSSSLRKWKNIVEAVSRRNLTYPLDILPCLSGLAARHLRSLNDHDQYLAGLWAKIFVELLIWKIESPSGQTDASQYLAPSWSWASVRAPTRFPIPQGSKGSRKPLSRLVDAKCFPIGQDPRGQLAGGYANMEGPCKTMILERIFATRLRLRPLDRVEKDRRALNFFKPDHHVKTLRLPSEAEVLCLTRPLPEGSEYGWYFLVLQKMTDKHEDLYERVGLWGSTYDFNGDEWLESSQMKCLKIL